MHLLDNINYLRYYVLFSEKKQIYYSKAKQDYFSCPISLVLVDIFVNAKDTICERSSQTHPSKACLPTKTIEKQKHGP